MNSQETELQVKCPNGCPPSNGLNPSRTFCILCNNTGWMTVGRTNPRGSEVVVDVKMLTPWLVFVGPEDKPQLPFYG